MPSSASACITSSTSLIISGSSAEVGSSNSIAFGSMASARAIDTRCCWPPESSSGRLASLLARPTRVSSCSRARVGLGARAPQDMDLRQADVLQRRHVRVELEVLEHHADPGAQRRQVGPPVGDRDAVDRDAAAVDRHQAVDALDQACSFRSPTGPQTTTTSPAFTVAVQSRRTWRAAIGLLDVARARSSTALLAVVLDRPSSNEKQIDQVDDRDERVHLGRPAVARRRRRSAAVMKSRSATT